MPIKPDLADVPGQPRRVPVRVRTYCGFVVTVSCWEFTSSLWHRQWSSPVLMALSLPELCPDRCRTAATTAGRALVRPPSRRALCIRQRHAVADTGLGEQVPRRPAIRLELAADALRERPDVVDFVSVLTAPHGLQHLAVQQDLAGIAREVGQHLVLAPGQRHVDPVQPGAAGAEVDLEPLI